MAKTETAVETTADAPESAVAAVQREYGRYRALGPLDYFGARAFNLGDSVPASHPMVPMWESQGYVEPIRPE